VSYKIIDTNGTLATSADLLGTMLKQVRDGLLLKR